MLEKGGLSFLRSEGSSQEHTDHPCFLPASGMFVNQKDRNPLPFFLSLLPFLSPSVIWANLRQVSSFGPNHPQWVKGGGFFFMHRHQLRQTELVCIHSFADETFSCRLPSQNPFTQTLVLTNPSPHNVPPCRAAQRYLGGQHPVRFSVDTFPSSSRLQEKKNAGNITICAVCYNSLLHNSL